MAEKTPGTIWPHGSWFFVLALVLALGGGVLQLLAVDTPAAPARLTQTAGMTWASTVPLPVQASVPVAGGGATLVAAQEGDLNAAYHLVIATTQANGRVTLTLQDPATGHRSTLTHPIGTAVVARDAACGGMEVLTRLPSIPEHIDMEKYAFPTSTIETIKQGQRVVSRDPVTGKTEIKTVAQTFKHTAYEIIQLDLADKSTGKCVESIRGTPEHPFFTPNGMVEMGKLKPGMEVSTRNTDAHLIVKAMKREQHPEGIPVYNFEAEDNHTYFVGQANGGVLVHNIGDCGVPRYNGSKPRYHINKPHIDGTPGKTPLPDDAVDVFAHAVPDDAVTARHWYGRNGQGQVYRFSNANDGTAHFSGIMDPRKLNPYIRARLGL